MGEGEKRVGHGYERVDRATELLDQEQRREAALAMLTQQGMMCQTAAILLGSIFQRPDFDFMDPFAVGKATQASVNASDQLFGVYGISKRDGGFKFETGEEGENA